MIGGAFFDGVLCGEGMLLGGERKGERGKGLTVVCDSAH